MAVDPRVVAPATALGAAALPQTFPTIAAPVEFFGRGSGKRDTPSNTSNSDNVPNMPTSGASNLGTSITEALKQLNDLQTQRVNRKTAGNQHVCYKQGCGMSYVVTFAQSVVHTKKSMWQWL